VERVKNYVFGVPFALERPRGPYFKAFQTIIEKTPTDFCFYFSDVVKEYEVVSTDKRENDNRARKAFRNKSTCQKDRDFLLSELEILNPTLICGLGNDAFDFLNKAVENKYNVRKVRHPSHCGVELAHLQLLEIIHEISEKKVCQTTSVNSNK
jgi:hypothetical protein